MQSEKNTARAPGFLIALGPIAGTVIGSMRGQPTLGFLGGMCFGVVALLVFWLLDRRR
jgi:hypothetical protein